MSKLDGDINVNGVFFSKCSDRHDGPLVVLTHGAESYSNRFKSDGDQLKVVAYYADLEIIVLRANGAVEIRNRRGQTLREL